MTDQLQQQSNSRPNLFRFAIVAAVAAVFLVPTYLKHRKESSRDALLAELQADEAHAASLVKIDEDKFKLKWGLPTGRTNADDISNTVLQWRDVEDADWQGVQATVQGTSYTFTGISQVSN